MHLTTIVRNAALAMIDHRKRHSRGSLSEPQLNQISNCRPINKTQIKFISSNDVINDRYSLQARNIIKPCLLFCRGYVAVHEVMKALLYLLATEAFTPAHHLRKDALVDALKNAESH